MWGLGFLYGYNVRTVHDNRSSGSKLKLGIQKESAISNADIFFLLAAFSYVVSLI